MLRFLARRPRTVKVPVENGSVDIQKVEVKRRSKPAFQFLVRLALAYCVVRTIWWLRSDEFKSRLEDMERARQSAKGQHGITQTEKNQTRRYPTSLTNKSTVKPSSLAQNSDMRDSIIRLTMPIWFREKAKEFFKSSDPEWQAVKDLQKDQKRSSELKRELVKLIASRMKSPGHADQLQYVGFDGRVSASLEIIPPLYAARSYEVPYVSIGPDWTFEFGWRTLSRAASAKTERMFHPVVFSQAFIAGITTFSTTTFRITKAKVLDQYYGSEPLKIKISMVQQGKRKIVTSLDLQKNMSRQQIVISQLPLNRLPEQQVKLHLPFLRGTTSTDSTIKKHYRDMVGTTTYQDAIEHASSVFKQTFLEKQLTAIQESTQGVCTFRGHVDFTGARGKYRVELVAFYMPTANGFIGGPRLLQYYIIPDLAKSQAKEQTTPGPAGVRPQQGHSTEEAPPIHQPPPPTEKPSPGKDAGK